MFYRGLAKGLKGRFSKLVEDQGQIPQRNTSSTLRFIPMETVQQPSQILILADIYLFIANLVSYGGSIAINSARLEVLLLKQEKEEVRNLFYRGRPEVHLIRLTPSDKNGPL